MKKPVLLAAFLLMFASGLYNNSISLLVVPVTQETGFTVTQFSFGYTLLQLTGAVCMPFLGGVLSRIGVRRMLKRGGVVCAAGLAAYALCRNLVFYYAVSVIIGIFLYCCTYACNAVVISSHFQEDKGFATGISMTGTGTCGFLMGFVVPLLLARFHWRAVYLMIGVLFLLTMVTVYLLLDFVAMKEAVPSSSDHRAAETAPGKEAATEPLRGMTWEAARKAPSFYILFFIVAGVVVSSTFFHHLSAYLTGRGFTAVAAGRAMSLISVLMIVFKIVLGKLYDSMGAAFTSAFSLLSFAGGLLVVMGSGPYIYFGILLLAIGISCTTVLVPLWTRTVFGEKDYTRIYSVISVGFSVGNASGMTVWGLLYDLTGTYRTGLVVAPALLAADLALLLFLFRKHKHS